MTRDWNEIRKDFPGTEKFVYLNAASTSLPPIPVERAIAKYFGELQQTGDLHWDEWVRETDQIRYKLARFIGAEPDEIGFVTNTSDGMNILADLLAPDGPVLSNEVEFPTVTLPWVHRGAQVHFIPSVEGEIRLEMFEEQQAPRASTIALSHVQFSNGFRLDLDRLAAIKGQRKTVLSGSQSVGVFPINVRTMKIDGLACAGHKWLSAGFGAGFVYVSKELLQRAPRTLGWRSVLDPFAFVNRQGVAVREARRYELGCPAFHGILALGAAVSYISDIGIDNIAERVLTLNTRLTEVIADRGFEILSPGGAARSGQTLVATEDPTDLSNFLRNRKILVTTKPQGIRVATHYYNNEADIEAFGEALGAYRAN